MKSGEKSRAGDGEEGPGSGGQNGKSPLLLGEIAFFGGMTIVYKSSIDLFLYVVGSSQENEVNSGGWGDKEGLSVGEWLGVWGRSWVPLLLNSGGR